MTYHCFKTIFKSFSCRQKKGLTLTANILEQTSSQYLFKANNKDTKIKSKTSGAFIAAFKQVFADWEWIDTTGIWS